MILSIQPIKQRFYMFLLIVSLFPWILSGCSKQDEVVSYTNDILPILQANCYECHLPGGKGYEASGLDMDTYDTLMKGTKYGPVIVPGDSLSSTLVILIEGRADKSINMPHNRKPLDDQDITTIKRWIDQGAINN